MKALNLNLSAAISACPVVTFEDLFDTVADLRKVEGDNLYKQIAKMNVAAGDLAACATEGKPGFPSKNEIADEVAALVMRSIMFGLHHNITPDDLRDAFQREATHLAQMGVEKTLNDALKGAGFTPTHSEHFTIMEDVQPVHTGGFVKGSAGIGLVGERTML